MKVAILVLSKHQDRLKDPRYPETHALGGSETAAVAIAEAWRKMGHEVELWTRPEEVKSAAVDIFVSLRTWEFFAKGIRPGRINYLWCMDYIDQPFMQDLTDPALASRVYEACDAVVLLCSPHIRGWVERFHVPIAKIFRSELGIWYSRFEQARKHGTSRGPKAYYASAPFRGLEVLLEMWPRVKTAVPEAELEIFSSLKTYGADEDPYTPLYDRARALPGIHYRGSVGQEALREVASECRAMAYPCIFQEMSSVAIMEAIASGCAVVSTDIGVLPESAWRNPLVPLGNGWKELWAESLIRVLQNDTYFQDISDQNIHLSKFYDWELISHRWIQRFRMDFAGHGVRLNAELK